MKKTAMILSLILLLTGWLGFVGGALISTDILEYNKEVPLGDIQGFVVDSSGNIYVGIGFYGKVQAYDKKGKFLRNWKACASGGAFSINLTPEQNILITTQRKNQKITFNQNGIILSKETFDNIYYYYETERAWNIFSTKQGDEYKVTGGIFPKIIKTKPERIIVSQGFVFQIIKGPFPAFLIAACGIAFIFLLRKNKIKRN